MTENATLPLDASKGFGSSSKFRCNVSRANNTPVE
jgi:hypothetical protein